MKPSILDISEAQKAVKAFNENRETIASERLVYLHFAGPLADQTSVAERVVLLDKLWATQMFRHSGHVAQVIASLESGEKRIVDVTDSLPLNAIEQQPEKLKEIAQWAMPIVLGHDRNVDKKPKYDPYSFASKYLHWISRGRFPIVDSYARANINRLQRQHDLTNRIWAGQGYWKDDYPRWIDFYSRQLIPTLTIEDRNHLLQADSDSLPPGQKWSNSLLRVLDKVFYQFEPSETGTSLSAKP